MLRAINTDPTHRPPVILMHRARLVQGEERNVNMESYRNQIINMLDTIQDARLMRMIHDVIKAILFNR